MVQPAIYFFFFIMIYLHKRWIFSYPIEWISISKLFCIFFSLSYFAWFSVVSIDGKVWRTFHSKYYGFITFQWIKREVCVFPYFFVAQFVLFSFFCLWPNNNLVNHFMLKEKCKMKNAKCKMLVCVVLKTLTFYIFFLLKKENIFFLINYTVLWNRRKGNDSLCSLGILHVFEIHFHWYRRVIKKEIKRIFCVHFLFPITIKN